MEVIEKDYKVYTYDTLTPGERVKIEHSVYSNSDLSDLLSLTIDEVSTLKEENIAKEQVTYEKVIEALKDWEFLAAITNKY